MTKSTKTTVLIVIAGWLTLCLIPRISLCGQAEERQTAQDISASATIAENPQKEAQQKAPQGMLLKTYELKYISASEFMRSAKPYVQDYSGTESTLTVSIWGPNVPEFEALLKKLDVEKKTIQFQIFSIVGTRETPPERYADSYVSDIRKIEDKNLRRVLEEMQGLWNFKYFQVESPSFVHIKEDTGGSLFKLVSRYDLDMIISGVNLRGSEPGKRTIASAQVQLNQLIATPNEKQKSTLLDVHDITFKEDGWLVVGVSGFNAGYRGSAIILVVHAIIK